MFSSPTGAPAAVKASPLPGGLLTTHGNSVNFGDDASWNFSSADDDDNYTRMWKDALTVYFRDPILEEYVKTFKHHYLDYATFLNLGTDDLNYLGVRVGHRKKLKKAVSEANAALERKKSTQAQTRRTSNLAAAIGARKSVAASEGELGPLNEKMQRVDELSPQTSEIPSVNALPSSPPPPIAVVPGGIVTLRNSKEFSTTSGVTWQRVSGHWPSLSEFLIDMSGVRETLNFPVSFDRLFFDNKPMPFVDIDHSQTIIGILLRIPDLNDEDGTSVATITNRIVLVIALELQFVLTYHNCETNPLEQFEAEWNSGRFDDKAMPYIVDTIMRKALRTYNTGIVALRDSMDDDSKESEGDDVGKVQFLTKVQKKAGVYKRCAEASRVAVEDLEQIETFRPFIKSLCDGLVSVESISEEVQSNALSTIDLTIALSEFKSNANLKIFTFMTILLQPVALATSWYGMNFANMPELLFEESYFVFAGAVWAAAIFIFLMVVYGARLYDAIKEMCRHMDHKGRGAATPPEDNVKVGNSDAKGSKNPLNNIDAAHQKRTNDERPIDLGATLLVRKLDPGPNQIPQKEDGRKFDIEVTDFSGH